MGILNRMNEAVNRSFIGNHFEMKERNTTFTKEFRGATATFMSMAYTLAVSPRILADSGGPCVPDEDGIFGPEYETCLEAIRREYVTSTAIASMFGCILMGVMANLPIALAPGMGLNAYFTVRTIACIVIV
jgi:AGZA family xanthine/uracil permease-like MFS transporter